MPDFAERLVSLRQSKNVLQRNIVEDTGIALRSLKYYEKGTNKPTSDVIVKLCHFFNISSDYLLGLSDEKRPLRSEEPAANQ